MAEYKIYVIRAERDACKIGIAKNPMTRLKQMQTGNHRKLSLEVFYNIGSQKQTRCLEEKIHKRLKIIGIHISGEWFQYKPVLIYEHIRKISQRDPAEIHTADPNIIDELRKQSLKHYKKIAKKDRKQSISSISKVVPLEIDHPDWRTRFAP